MKKIIPLVLMLALLLPCCAFAQETAAYYPVTVTDCTGREVVIEKAPERLISGYYIPSSLVIALDLDEKMVGIESKAETRPVYALSAPALLELPQVGTAKALDLELCTSLEPDLVILPLRQKDSAAIFADLGIDALLVSPESREQLFDTIKMIGAATNTMDKANALMDFIVAGETHLQTALADVTMPTVYLSGNSNFLSTAGDLMYQSDLIRLAGGVNVAAEIQDTYWAEIDYEQLLVWNPEYIILASDAKYTVDDVLADPNLANCTAVMNKNVYQIPGDAEAWDSPVPGSILGSIWLASVLHPDKVDAAACTEWMNNFYETFYGFTYAQN